MRLLLAAAFSCAAVWAACAQEPSSPPQTTAAAGAPGLADIMGATQLRHLKLSYAGSLKNWPLAQFEVAQIRNSFQSAAKSYPEFGDVPVAKLINDISEPALVEVDKAIAAHDSAAFNESFKSLTKACNSCHQAAKVGFIRIQVPTASPFSNQAFAPSGK